ncbi:MAG TPA: hypothetical protein VGL81_11275 [Polyangiaceae bacterium]|jgi:hypothetical protein
MNQYPYPPPNMPYAQPPPQQGYPQQPPPPTAEDETQLNTLAICHYIYAGMLGLFGLFGLIYVVFGVILATASLGATGAGHAGPPPAAIGGVVAAIGGFITVFLWAKAACVAYSGMSLKKRQKRTFSFVIACICCVNIPLGTALGVFTLVVLSRPTVKAIYDRVAYYGA